MALEIERKFLIDIDKLPILANGYDIKQGYIQTKDKTAVRVRVKGDEAFLTIKGESVGATRLEYEYAIPVVDANEMLDMLCGKPIIDKTRYLLKHKNHLWEIDIFHKENEGLIVAEVELESEDESVELPEWIVKEVTEDARYYNSNLLEHPYSQWG
ncbi:adenylate cyclase [Sulfurimonas gotlandica GD1]|uniref:Adenylate cyclase n=1 Tax=Sulfurimonas gotlandica (strain DSM 19862 / JCM 16533 / GD1) TaxID=929558 RepID=B6BMN0_SULGG|nr:CYTH domain-containing protein [Sulfurimonas gotlandica]EDZ61645.1 adenylate cyclase [Sulfurimonas gotlandica GD1]EHP30853.1 adenylate cyclase [Sulfurimonas gotlandica GD1]